MARPVFFIRCEGMGLGTGALTREGGRLGPTPRSAEKTGRCSGSRWVSMANVSVSSSTSCGGLLGLSG